jgi:DNA invertase Pin-like site-specific DNA recombinase
MGSKPEKLVRCAIYTRKSTEHGLELEFNSLHAQREACEAYVKSQVHEGWTALSKRYDDPAYSGGNLERPAVQRLLKDIEAGLVDVVVVYKIDRLTRSLSDFAKLVELFDKKAISFVAVTQQFNTTTSMGRLTLNVLLSFAQFERELSSERVRDKVAASRKKGKWMGGSVPLGYDTKDKKLVVNHDEANTVRMIFARYLALKSFRKLIDELSDKDVVTKKRAITGKIVGCIPFTCGPLAYLLKNRTYLGETNHKEHWYPGEHEAIIGPTLFDAVQSLLKTNSVTRHQQRSDNQSLLAGLLFDDRGNRMSPSFTTKRGVRYRSYVSSAILTGRRSEAGSVTRVSAPELETGVVAALRKRFTNSDSLTDADLIRAQIQRVALGATKAVITVKTNDATENLIELPRPQSPTSSLVRIETDDCQSGNQPDIGLVHALARAHLWLKALTDGTYKSIDELANIAKWNPKVVRKVLRLAFLAPDITEAIILGPQPYSLSVSELQGVTAFSWVEQRRLLRFTAAA